MKIFKNFTLSILLLLPLGVVAQTHCCCPNGTCQEYVSGSINCFFSCNVAGLGQGPPVPTTDGCPSTPCSTLPISLIIFDAKPTDEGVVLNWETETEINNQGFQVQRMSGVNFDWEIIDFVEGVGNSSRPEYYYFLDQTAPAGTNYYRLNQIDFDGTSTFSQIETARTANSNKLELWPKMTRTGVVIRNDNVDNQMVIPLVVYNMMGIKVIENSFTESILLDVSSLMPGNYFVNMLVNNKIETLKFIKVE